MANRTFSAALLLSALVLAGATDTAEAQIPPQVRVPGYQRPTISPYLGLLNNQNSPAFNYYTRVRPQQHFITADVLQSNQITDLRREIDRTQDLMQSELSTIAPTGHTTSFMSLGGYFAPTTGVGARIR